VGAAALARLAADLEHRAKTEPGIALELLFSQETLVAFTGLIDRSDAALSATMPRDPAKIETFSATGEVATPPEELATRLLEIQTLLRAGNLRAIDMTQELLGLTSGDDKKRVQELLDTTERLQFSAAEKFAQSLLESLH
ncbi:MAG: hypothetical protein ABI410_16360, partial [Rhodoferax sp.]